MKVKVETKNQFDLAINEKEIKDIIISRDSFPEFELEKLVKIVRSKNKNPWILMERVSRYEELSKDNCDLRKTTDKIFDIEELYGVIIQNLDSFSYLLRKINKVKNEKLEVELNYTMNCYNIETKKVYSELYNEKRDNHKDVPLKFTAPLELNQYELKEVGYDTLIVYSYVDTMVSANCLRKNIKESLDKDICKYRFDFDKGFTKDLFLYDRLKKELHYKTYCKYCYNKIFNVSPLYLIDILDEIKLDEILDDSSYDNLRIDFSFEDSSKVKDIFNRKKPKDFTRGHIKNSIY